MHSDVYVRQRVGEMRNGGYIEINGDDLILTAKGEAAAKMMRGLGQIYGLNGTYEQMLREVSGNAKGAEGKKPLKFLI
jgi:hypothetical protein